MNLSESQLDKIKEIINIGVGRSAASLNQLLGKRIQLKVPVIEIVSSDTLKQKFDSTDSSKLSIVKMGFKGELNGLTELVFPLKGANEIVKIASNNSLNLQDNENQLSCNVLIEVGNIILNALVGTMANMLKTRIRYKIPQYIECSSNELVKSNDAFDDAIIYAETNFKVVNEDISGRFILFLEIGSFEKLTIMLKNFAVCN